MADPLDDDLTRRFFDILHGDSRIRIGGDATHEYVTLAARLAAVAERQSATPVVVNVYGTPSDLAEEIAKALARLQIRARDCGEMHETEQALWACQYPDGHDGPHSYEQNPTPGAS